MLLLRQWQRTHDSQERQVEMVPLIIPARFTRLLIPSWEGGRDVHPGPRTLLSFLGGSLMLGWVTVMSIL